MRAMRWPVCVLLSTWQKVAPMILIFQFSSYRNESIYVGAVASAVVGAFGVVAQNHMRALIAYSSINHMGWIAGVRLVSFTTAFNYMVFYIIIISPVIVGFYFGRVKHYGVTESVS